MNQNGTLKNAAVRVIKGGSTASTTPVEAVVIDQKDCVYHPRVVGVGSNQKVVIQTSDPVLHNVHSYFGTATGFNRALLPGFPDIEKTFPAGITKLTCDVHPWMIAWIIVNDNPFIAVTGDSGEFILPNVSAGTYTLEAWHETYGTKTVDLAVKAGETAPAEFVFGS